jgi:hypothetical protein
MSLFTQRKLATSPALVDTRKPKCSFLYFTPGSGTALSKNNELSEFIQNRELAACFIRVGAPNDHWSATPSWRLRIRNGLRRGVAL